MRLRLIDRLIYRELIGPWLMGVMLFSVLLMAGTYLFRLTELAVLGIPIGTVVTLSGLYMPYLVVKTFPMAMLLASLLAFGRLSNDSEVVAAQAGGASMFTIMRPVALFGLAVSMLTFAFGEIVVPAASRRATELQHQVARDAKKTTAMPFYQPLSTSKGIRGGVMAQDVDINNKTMKNVTASWFNDDMSLAWVMFAREMYFTPEEQWKIRKATVFYQDGQRIYSVNFDEAFPPEGDKFNFTPKGILASQRRDNDAKSLIEIREEVEALEETNLAAGAPISENERKIRELEVGYWTKIALPFSSLVFALVGAPAGIRRTRQTFGAGIMVSIMIIFLYYVLHNYLSIMARGGILSPPVGAFLPVAVGLITAAILLSMKNR